MTFNQAEVLSTFLYIGLFTLKWMKHVESSFAVFAIIGPRLSRESDAGSLLNHPGHRTNNFFFTDKWSKNLICSKWYTRYISYTTDSNTTAELSCVLSWSYFDSVIVFSLNDTFFPFVKWEGATDLVCAFTHVWVVVTFILGSLKIKSPFNSLYWVKN